MSADSGDAGQKGHPSYGPQPGERVFTGGPPMPRTLRVRPAVGARPTGLRFEPETGSQSEALAELAAAPAPPKSSLAFEPDEGDLLDRAREAQLPSEAPPPVGRESPVPEPAAGPPEEEAVGEGEEAEIASLIELAAGMDGDKGASSGGRRTFTPAPRRADLSGDIEAEFFGPKPARHTRRHAARAGGGPDGEDKPVRRGAEPASKTGAVKSASRGEASAEPPGEGAWKSVLLSDAAVGRKKKRPPSTRFMRTTRTAEKAIERTALSFVVVVRGLDMQLGRVRLSLGGIFSSAIITAVAVLIGVPLAWAGGILAICLMLTVAGQPARNLLGYAGVVIAAAATAEIVRQRERFVEIFKMFFS